MWLFFAGPGGFLTSIFAAMKLAGTIQWSWWWVLVPLGVNIAVWTLIYVAAVLFAHFVLGKIH